MERTKKKHIMNYEFKIETYEDYISNCDIYPD